jgi:hypothetical protein
VAPTARAAIALGALALVVVAVHAPVGRADFSFDDKHYVLLNSSIRSLPAALDAFVTPFPPHRPELGLYRPLTNLSYALDYALFGENARGYHATNVALYAATVWLVFALGRRYAPGIGFAFALALLFAVHPVHCEAVDSVTGRSELLALLFASAALWSFLRAIASPRASPVWLGISVATYALACLSKETGVMAIAVLAAHALAYAPRSALRLAPHALVLAGYLALRIAALGDFATVGVLAGRSLAFRLHAIGMAYSEYAGLLLFPRTLQIDYFWERLFLHPRETWLQAGLGWLVLGSLLLALAAVAWRQARAVARAGDDAELPRLLLCGLAIWLAFLFPVSHVVPIGSLMAERFLYAPSLGFCLVVVVLARSVLVRGVRDARVRMRLAAGALALVAATGAARSHARAAEWRDEIALWLAADRDVPGDPRVLTNLAYAYEARDRFADARATLARARSATPRLPEIERALDQLDRYLGRVGR